MPEATADSKTIRAIQATINAIEERERLRETGQLTDSADPLASLKRLTDPIIDYAYVMQLHPRALCEYLRTGEQRRVDGALDVLHRIAASVRFCDAHEHTSPAEGDELIDCNQAAELFPRSASYWRDRFGREIKQRGTGKNGAKLCSLREVARYAEDQGILRR